MQNSLRALNVEDSERDEGLLKRHLVSAGYTLTSWDRVDTPAAMSAALSSREWDIVLCDYAMPHFDALMALDLLRKTGIDIPFIIISGTVGEDVAVQAMLTGAHDYVSKDNLTRLVPAVERELKEAKNRRELRATEAAHHLSEERYRTLFEYAPDGIIISGPDDYYLDANTSMCRMLGYDHTELKGMHASDIVIRSEERELDSEFALVQSTPDYNREWHFKRKDGSIFPAEVIATIMPDGNLLAMIRDTSERNRAAEALNESSREKAESLALIDTILSRAPIGFAFHDREMRYIRINETLAAINGLSVEQHLGRTLLEMVPKMARILDPIMRTVMESGVPVVDYELTGETQAEPGKPKVWEVSFYPVRMEGGEILGVGVLVAEVTERRQAENALRESEEKYRDLVENAIDVIYTLDLEGNYTSMNRAGERISGYPREASLTRNIADSIVPEYRDKAMQMIRAQMDGHDISAFEIEIVNREGRRVALEVNTRAIQENGITVGVQGIARDITERKEKEAEVHRQRIELRALFDYIPAMICFKDTKNRIIRANKLLASTAGKSVEEMEGQPTEELFPEFAEKYFADDLEVIDSRLPKLGIIETVKDPKGNDVTIQTDKIPMFDLDGEVSGLVVMATDITERRRDEEKLRESEERFAGAFELAPIGVALVLPNGRWLKVNRALCQLTGYTESELLEISFQDITHPDDVKNDVVNSRRLLKGKIAHYQMEKRYIHKLGHIVFVSINVSLVRDGEGKPRYFISQIQDITARKLAQDELRESESLLATSQRITHLGSWIMDISASGKVVENSERWSDEHYRIFGFEPGEIEITGESIYNSVHPEDREPLAKMLRETIDHKQAYDLEHRIILTDGTERIVHTMAEMVLDETGKPLKLIGSVQDITERKKVDAALRESDEKFHQLADNITDVFWIRSPDMAKIYYVSPAYEKIWGRSLDSDYSNPYEWQDFIVPEDLPYVKAAYVDLMNGASKIDIEYRIVGINDELRWVRARGFQVRDAEGTLIRLAGIVSDITKSKQAIEALGNSEERYRDLVENAIDVIYTLDLEGNYTSMNRASEEVTGYTVEESLQRNIIQSMAPEYREQAKQLLAAQVHGENLAAFELEIIAKDGHRVALEIKTRPIKEKGVAVGVQGIARDVTQRKLTDARINRLVNSNAQGVFFWNTKGEISGGNDAFLTITGYSREDIDAGCINWVTLTPPEYAYLDKIALDHLAASGTCPTYEKEFIRKDGSRIFILLGAAMLEDNHEEGVCFILDITDRKQTEAALEESEASFRSLHDTTNDAILVLNKGVVTGCNPRTESMFHCTKEWIIGRTPMEFSPPVQPDGRQATASNPLYLTSAIEGIPQFFEWQHVRKDGTLFDAEVSLNKVEFHGETHVQAIIRDITERKRADAQLQESHRRVEDIVNSVEGIVWEADAQTFTFNFVSAQAEQILGYPSKRWTDDPTFWSDHIHPEDRDKAVKFCTDSTNKLLAHEFEYRMLAEDGRYVWIKDTVTVLAEDGRAVKLRGILMDITDRKQAENLLLESKEQLALAAESARLGIWDWNIVENRMEWDDRMYELYGIRAEEFGGAYEAWEQGLHSEDLQSGKDSIKAALAGERPFNNEFRVVWPNGEIHNIEARAVVKRDGNGEPLRMIGVNWDITDRKILEEQYRQSQKMEAVGVLAGGIAHDFNNLLTAINGFSDLALRKMEVDSPFRRNIQEVKNAGARAAELTGQLLAFSRKQVLKPSVISLNSVISNIEKMLRRIIRESVELRVILDPKLGNVLADAGQVEQVIMNLAINARDAMPGGGNLTIETKNTYLGEEYVNQHISVLPGDYVRITVSDTGEGMDAATQSHIFEPFFTTKEVGKGTGLGLATVYGIVKQSGGTIMVYSELGHGTTFKVYLPCVDKAVERPLWHGENEAGVSGSETILLVEDEDAVRSFVTEVLESSGYTVLSAANGPDALAICQNYSTPIELLVSDVIMPKMGGAELKKHVVALLPDIKVLFISGYTDDSIAHRGIDDPNIAFLEKPFTPDALTRKVRDVLGSL